MEKVYIILYGGIHDDFLVRQIHETVFNLLPINSILNIEFKQLK